MESSRYNKSFQYALVTHLVRCPKLLETAVGKLRMDDFDLVICQAVWEALNDYYDRFGGAPDFDTFQVHLSKVIANADMTYRSMISPEDMDAMLELVDYMESCDALNEEYYLQELPVFVRRVRSANAVSRHQSVIMQGGESSALAEELDKINSDADEQFDRAPKIEFMTEDPDMIMEESDEWHLSTGCPKLDAVLDGGPVIGNVCMVTACPGVGKSNTLLNMAAATSLLGVDSLTFTLELPGTMIKRRLAAMTAGIPAALTKKAVTSWPEAALRRIALMVDPSFPAYNKAAVVDSSNKKMSLRDIESYIVKWTETVKELTGTNDNCKLVCVDWIKYILPPSEARGMDQWERLTLIAEQLGFIARRHGVIIWTANQGKATADGRSILQMNDTAFGYHINDALDISMGLGLAPDAILGARETFEGDSDELIHGGRKMIAAINKNRSGNLKAVEMFQAPTLRFHDDEATFHAMARALQRIGDDHLKLNEIMAPKIKRRLVHDITGNSGLGFGAA